MSQDRFEDELAELMGVMQGSMVEFQRSMDELVDAQQVQARETSIELSKALSVLKEVEQHSQAMLEAQKKALDFINRRWADSLLEKAQEAGHAQARIFGKAIAQEAVQSIQQELATANQAAKESAVRLQKIAQHLTWRWIGAGILGALGIVGAVIGFLCAFLPSQQEIEDLQAEKVKLEATIAALEKKGARAEWTTCGPKKKVCVKVDRSTVYAKDYMILHTGGK